MATVSISPISSPNGETLYQAVAGKLTSLGKTAGQALDALTAQLDLSENSQPSHSKPSPHFLEIPQSI